MAFTYDLSSSDPDLLLISKLRLEIGDNIQNKGVLPEDANFSDEELDTFLDRMSGDFERAAAIACHVLANTWARAADITIGPRKEALSQIASRYEKRAKTYADRLGMSTQAFSVGLNRDDGYEAYNSTEEYAQ